MKPASSRRYTALLILPGMFLLAVIAFVLFGAGRAAIEEYRSRGDVLRLAQAPMPQGEINVNTASLETLMRLPGIGEAVGAQIIAERESKGPFRFPEDLLAVKGIGEKKLADMLPHIRLDDRP